MRTRTRQYELENMIGVLSTMSRLSWPLDVRYFALDQEETLRESNGHVQKNVSLARKALAIETIAL